MIPSKIEHISLSEKIYQNLKENILNGRYSPGERLMYDQLTKTLNVSQTPLREAFVRLENEGLLVIVPNRGTFVKEFSKKEIIDIFEIRSMLEALATRLACGKITTSDVGRLKKTCTTFKRYIDKKNLKECVKTDFYFHELIITLSGNQRLESMIDTFNLHNFSFFESGDGYFLHARQYLQDHLDLTEAITGKQEAEAERIMRAHIELGKNNVLRFLNGKKDVQKPID